MIILYDKKKTDSFNRNDLVLKNVTKCEVTWEKNGQFQIDLVYPIAAGDTTWKSIVKGAIIKCPVAYQQDQLFRLNTPSKKLDDSSGYFYIEVTGYHITYDLNDNFLEDVRPTSKTGVEAGQYILANTQYSHPFSWIGDITDINTAYYIRKNPINALIGDDDNSYLNRWGGELVRDNFNIGMFEKAGEDRGVIIKYSKNLTGFEQSGDDSNLMTRCLPYCTVDTSSTDNTETTTTDTDSDDDLKPVFKLPEKYIDSPLINKYSHPYVKAVQVELTDEQQKLNNKQKYTIMRNYVADLYQNKHVDVPVYSYNVNFIDLANTEEYKDYAILEEVHPYDYVTIKALGIDVIAELVGYTYDSLNRQYETITFGNMQNDIIRHNQKSLFQISKQNEQSIKILQAQMQDVPNSMQAIAENVKSGGNNLFDHSVLEDKYIGEWISSNASIISDNSLHDTDKVWSIPAGAGVTKKDIVLNPNNYKGQQLTFSLSAKYSGLTLTYDDNFGSMSSAKLGSLSVKYRKCLADSVPGNWLLMDNGIITDYVPIEPGKGFVINNSQNYTYKLLAYDGSYNLIQNFTNDNATPSAFNAIYMRVEIILANMYPEQIKGFSIYETTEREFPDLAYLYANNVDSTWKTCETTFTLSTGNTSDVITHVNFEAKNQDTSGTIYIGGFMLNTGTVRSDYSQSSNDTVQTLRAHQIYADYIEAKQADIDKLHATNATIDTLSSTYATITKLNVVSGNIENLKASVGNIIDLTTNTLKSHVVTADNIETGTITAGSGIIATGAIKTAQIADGSVTDAKIVGLTANKITAGTIDATNIDVINLKAANITVGTINGQQIAQNTISTGNLTNDLSTSITTAINDSNNAIKAVNGKNSNYYGSTTPTSPNSGDLWMKPVDGGIKPMQWNGSEWVDMTDITAIMAKQGIDNIQIGGTNLLRNSAWKTDTSYWGLGANVNRDVSIVTSDGINSICSNQSGRTSDAWQGLSSAWNITKCHQGEQYTASVWTMTDDISKIDHSANLEIDVFDANGNRIGIPGMVPIVPSSNNTWQRFFCTAKIPAGAVYVDIYAYVTRNGKLWVAKPKLEKGNKSTDWSPAPRDTQTQISGVTLTNMLGVTGDSLLVTKTASDGWGNAGCSSIEQFGEGDYVEFTVGSTDNARQMLGLSHTDADQNYKSIQYAWYMDNSNALYIFESNANVASWNNAWFAGDKFRISVEKGKVNYYHNGTLVRTSPNTPVLPLVLDLALYTQKSSIDNITKGHMVTGLSTDVNYLKTTIKELDASYITTGMLSSDRIGSRSITADKLVSGCITSASGVIGALDAGAITTGTLAAERIGAGSITADKLQIGDGTNLADCNEITGSNVANQWSTTTISNGYVTRTNNSSSFFMITNQKAVSFRPNEQLYFEFYAISDSQVNATFSVWTYPNSLTYGNPNGNTNSSTFNIGTSETKINGYIRVPEFDPLSTVSFVAGFWGVENKNVRIRKVFLRRISDSTSIASGCITTDKIATNTILANNIASNTITGEKLVADSITAREIASKTITANEIAANSVGTEQLIAGSITASSGIIESIDASKIRTGTLNASLVNVTNLNASNITSGSLSASRISGGILSLGGGYNGNGQEIVYNVSGKEVARLDNAGLTITLQEKEDGYLSNAFKIQAYNRDLLMNIDGDGQFNYFGLAAFNYPSSKTQIVFDSNGMTFYTDAANNQANAVDTFQIKKGTGDGADWNTYNTQISSWYGLAFGSTADYDGTFNFKPKILFNCRTGDIDTWGHLNVAGAKHRIVKTEHYGSRLMNAVESADSIFIDYNRGKLVNGQCIINMDSIWLETVNTNMQYEVKTWAYGNGNVWVETKDMHPTYFIVRGSIDIEFGYEIIAKQKDYEDDRLQLVDIPV